MRFDTLVRPASLPRINKLLKRLERAHERRGLEFKCEIKDDLQVRTRNVGPHGKIKELVQTVSIDMQELSADYEILYKAEPVDINSPAHGQPVIRKWNPMVSMLDYAKITHPNDLFEDRCDHCNAGKRGRHSTYRLKSKVDGSYVTVGSSCLYEYTDIKPEDIDSLIRFKGFAEVGYAGERNTRTHPQMDLTDFALIAGLWVHNGLDYQKGLGTMFFRQITYAQKRSDGKHDLGWLSPSDEGWKFMPVVKDIYGLEGEGYFAEGSVTFDRAPAVHGDKFMQYMSDLAGLNSFEQNVRNIAKAGVVTSKTANLAGGAIAGYMRANREQARQTLRKMQEAKSSKSEWVGEVGKRQSLGTCTVMFTRRLENQWGCTTLTRFTDSEDNMIVWFRSGNHDDLTVGMEVSLTATVKKHDSYKEVKQTTITRGRIQ